MTIQPAPGQRILDDHDIKAILARNSVGRLAFVRDDEIDVIPIQYVYKQGAIYGRTAPEGKLVEMDRAGTRVAFEVDEVRSTRDWVSVLTHGTFRVLDPRDEGTWQDALRIVRHLHHEAFSPADPRSHQTELFKIEVRKVTGRATA